MKNYIAISGSIFAIVAFAHLIRIVDGWGLFRVMDAQMGKGRNDIATGELLVDWRGEYMLLNSGVKLYVGIGEVVAKDIRLGKYKAGRINNFYYKTRNYNV